MIQYILEPCYFRKRGDISLSSENASLSGDFFKRLIWQAGNSIYFIKYSTTETPIH